MHFKLTIFSIFILSIVSCTKLNEEDIIFDAELQKLCDLDSSKFSVHVAPIISENCMPCHDDIQAEGGITLLTYDDISFQAIDGLLLKAIKHESGAAQMPNAGDKLHNCYIEAIEQWVAQGALNN